jgi:hypothetical protein
MTFPGVARTRSGRVAYVSIPGQDLTPARVRCEERL